MKQQKAISQKLPIPTFVGCQAAVNNGILRWLSKHLLISCREFPLFLLYKTDKNMISFLSYSNDLSISIPLKVGKINFLPLYM